MSSLVDAWVNDHVMTESFDMHIARVVYRLIQLAVAIYVVLEDSPCIVSHVLEGLEVGRDITPRQVVNGVMIMHNLMACTVLVIDKVMPPIYSPIMLGLAVIMCIMVKTPHVSRYIASSKDDYDTLHIKIGLTKLTLLVVSMSLTIIGLCSAVKTPIVAYDIETLSPPITACTGLLIFVTEMSHMQYGTITDVRRYLIKIEREEDSLDARAREELEGI